MITTDTHVYFWGGESIYSNFHTRPRQFKDPLNGDLTFSCSEVAFMWWKAVFFQDHRIAGLLETETEPRTAKSLGRQIKGFDEKKWECVRLGFMTYVLLCKFEQNADYLAEIKATGDRVLVEASPYDRIWGIGLSEADAAAGKPWDGLNLLGEALMKVRGLL